MIHNENKQAIAVYMKWRYWPGGYGQCYRVTEPWGKTVLINFDLNDAGLCVQEMQKRGEWWNFLKYANTASAIGGMFPEQFIALLFNTDNFFTAMAQWIREEKK